MEKNHLEVDANVPTELSTLTSPVVGLGDPEALASNEDILKPSSAVPDKGQDPSGQSIPMAVVLYGVCSASLLIINKVAMWILRDASFLLFCQFLSSSLTVRLLKIMFPDMDIEFLQWQKAKPFFLASLVFYVCLLANTKALQSVNVETVIVVRSCSPIAVVFLEHLALGRPLPTLKGLLALTMIALGAIVYVMADDGFQIHGYLWLTIYFVFIVVEMVFVKFIVDTIPMSTWTRVYYNNTLSLPLALLSAVALGDSNFMRVQWSTGTVIAVAASCIVGIGISYAGFNLRKLVSATSFTVVGVVCKLVTVLVNDVIWSLHSTMLGHLGLAICIGSGFWYERCKAEQRELAATSGSK